MASKVNTDGIGRLNPAVYLRPTAHATSSSPASMSNNHVMMISSAWQGRPCPAPCDAGSSPPEQARSQYSIAAVGKKYNSGHTCGGGWAIIGDQHSQEFPCYCWPRSSPAWSP